MDANKDSPRKEDEQAEHQHPGNIFPQPLKETTPRPSTSSISSLNSQDPGLGTDADDPPSSDMDGAGDTHRRRRAQLMEGLRHDRARGKRSGRKHSQRRHRSALGGPDEERKHMAYSSDDGHGSDFSSISTSDDVELSHLASEDALTDDEEAGLTKKDREHRKRKRRRNTRLDGRVAGSVKTLKQEQKVADRNVLKAMIINVLLIMSWYIFSLSISIVSVAT